MVGQVLCGRFLRCKRRVSRRSDAGFFAKLIGVNFNACPSHVEEHFQPLGLRQLRVDFDHDVRSASVNVRRGVTAVAAPEPCNRGKGVWGCLWSSIYIDRARTWDYYMVHDDLWQVAGVGIDMLCLGCFAQRAGRPLEAA